MGDSPSPLPHPDRHGWVITFGVLEILLGAGCLLLAALVAYSFLQGGGAAAAPNHAAVVGVAFGVGLYLLLAVFFFAGGIGSLRYKSWARTLMLIGSGIWLVFGILGVVVMSVFLPKIMAVRFSVSPGTEHTVLLVAIGIEVFFGILLPLAFLIFYTRKSVKATFLARGAARAGAGDPQAPSANSPSS